MSEFHRMITYLYLYEQGVKSRNIGFAKVEKRDQRCLLEIHMKNTGYSLSPVKVYFYLQKQEQLAGISLGNFSLTRGNGDFKTVLNAESLMDSGYPLDAVKGVFIPLSERAMLVSQWDDDEFRRDAFIDIEELPDQSKSPVPEELPNEENAEITEPKEEPPLDAKEVPAPDSALAKERPPAVPKKETAPDLQASPSSDSPDKALDLSSVPQENKPAFHAAEAPLAPDSPKTTDALKALEALPRLESRTSGFRTVSRDHGPSKERQAATNNHSCDQRKSDSPEDWQLRWRFILENYPVMTPFSGDEHTLCVRLELKDLRQLPKAYWYLGNNSFLLHGFFNYRYLILGMTEEFGVKKWFIGVPGVFQNPERVMAALFGFPEFRSEKPSPINTGQFGYWYHYLNELSQAPQKEES